MYNYCNKTLTSRSKYDEVAAKKCHLAKDHTGACKEFPFLDHLFKVNKQIANKIKRDSTMTTGAAWKSKDAGPNRILRWVMLLTDKELLKYGIDMTKLKPQVVSKLREKAADYDSCVQVAIKLTWLVYQIPGTPIPPKEIKEYLEEHFGKLENVTPCCICLEPLAYKLFSDARRGKAVIETCHFDPRQHDATNVGFAHRECNIAQGNKTLDEFYTWIESILNRAGKIK
jgi:hypothetical protein